MSITYNQNEPARNSNPSVSQPIMQQNAEAINNIIAVDHVTFNSSGTDVSGQHSKITYNNIINPGAPVDPKAFQFTNIQVGQSSSKPQLYYRNSEALYMTSCLKAFGGFTTAGPVLLGTGYNVVSVTGTNPYTITLTANTVQGTQYLIIASTSAPTVAGAGVAYNILSSTQFTFTVSGTASVVSFAILQF